MACEIAEFAGSRSPTPASNDAPWFWLNLSVIDDALLLWYSPRHSVTVLERSGISPHNAVERHLQGTAIPLSIVAVESRTKTVPALEPIYTSRRSAVTVWVSKLAHV